VAEFLASVGTTSDEAEQLRPWATAYVAMELEDYPNSEYATRLRQARDLARARINSDSRWVLKKVSPDAPGYYNPELDQARAARESQPQAEAGSSSNAKAGPSAPTSDAGPSTSTRDAGPSTSTNTASSSTTTFDGNSLVQTHHRDDADENTVLLEYEEKSDEDIRMGPA
jgi:hypothetical protein